MICDHYTKTFGIAEFLDVSMNYGTVKLVFLEFLETSKKG